MVGCLLALLAGCARDEEYLQVAREQRAAMKEVADVLETIRDEKSMAEAKASLDELVKKTEAIAERARSLPQPPPDRVLERMKEESHFAARAVERLSAEASRVSNLPGGKAFLKQYDTGSTGFLRGVAR